MKAFKTSLTALGSAVALAGLASIYTPAHATPIPADISFLQTAPGQVPVVIETGFLTDGSILDGANYAIVTGATYTTTLGAANVPSGTVAIVDPNTGNTIATEYVDVSVSGTTATLDASFFYNATPTTTVAGTPTVVSTGGAIDLTDAFADNTGAPVALPPGVTATANVPEPASLALLAGGLAGLGLIRRRRG